MLVYYFSKQCSVDNLEIVHKTCSCLVCSTVLPLEAYIFYYLGLRENKGVLEPRVSPAFAITYFCNHCNIRFDPIPTLNQRSLTPR